MSKQNKQKIAAGFLLLVLILGSYIVGFIGWASTGGTREPKSTAQCSGSNVVNNVTESSLGIITLNCLVAGGGDTASTFQCPNNQYAFNITETSAGAISFVCSSVSWSQLVNFPSACGSGMYVFKISTTITCSAPVHNVVSSINTGLCSNNGLNPTVTVSSGFGASITPGNYTTVVVLDTPEATSNITTSVLEFMLYRTQSAVPACNSTPLGTALAIWFVTISVAGSFNPAVYDYRDTGLTVGTFYSYYTAIACQTSCTKDNWTFEALFLGKATSNIVLMEQ